MMRSLFSALVLTLACLVGGSIATVQRAAAQANAAQELKIRGKIVKINAPDRFVVQTDANKEVILYANSGTRYVINGKAGRYTDLRPGVVIDAVYVVRNERPLVNSVTIGVPNDDSTRVIEGKTRAMTLRGDIVKIQAPNTIVVRTVGGKEVTLLAGDKTRYVIRGKAGKISELRTGQEVNVVYGGNDRRKWVETITVGDVATDPPGEGTFVQGSVLRRVGDEQVVIRTADNKEVIVYVAPTTKYVFENQPGRITDVQTGADVRIQYDVRDRRNIARSIIGLRRQK